MIKEDTQINSIFHIIKDIFRLFYYNRKKEFVFLLLIIFFSSVFEVVTFAFIIPVIYLINNPKPIFNNTYLNFIYLRMHFKAPVFFIFFLFFLIFVVFLIKNLFLLFSNFLQNKLFKNSINQVNKMDKWETFNNKPETIIIPIQKY